MKLLYALHIYLAVSVYVVAFFNVLQQRTIGEVSD